MHDFLVLAQEDTSGGLIDVVPGLMIWTLICFAITFFVLRKYAFGPIQRTIDERRDRIRKAVEEADNARAEAQQLLEQHRALIASAKSDAADILAEARKVGDAQIERALAQRRQLVGRRAVRHERAVRAPHQLLGRQPADALHEAAFDLAAVDAFVE